MSKKTTLESAYFHINNGGVTFSIVERLDTRKSPIYKDPNPDGAKSGVPLERQATGHETLYNRSWRFRVETHHFGSGVSFSFPLVPLMVRWTVGALERVLARMETPQGKPSDGFEFAFRDLDHCSISARDGQRIEEHWPFEPERLSGSKGCTEQSA